jgi:hypothetical protein
VSKRAGGTVALVVRSGILEHTVPVALVPFDAAFNQDMKVLTPREGVSPRWLMWVLTGANQDLLSRCRKDGTTVASLDFDKLKSFSLVLPPREVQERISAAIEEELERLSAIEADLDEVDRLNNQFRQAIMRDAFAGRLVSSSPRPEMSEMNVNGQPELPPGWSWKRFDEIAEPVSVKEKVKKGDYLPSGALPVIDQGDGQVGGFTDRQDVAVSGSPPFVIFGDHTRRVKLVQHPFAAGADGVKVLKPSALVTAEWLTGAISVAPIEDRGYARHYALLKSVRYPVPPLEVQASIQSLVEQHLQRSDVVREEVDRLRVDHARIRSAVLYRAFMGQLLGKQEGQKRPA